MKKTLFICAAWLSLRVATAQETVYPAKEQKGLLFIKNGTVHVGNGQVLENATIEVRDGKITKVGSNIAIPAQPSYKYIHTCLDHGHKLGMLEIEAEDADEHDNH